MRIPPACRMRFSGVASVSWPSKFSKSLTSRFHIKGPETAELPRDGVWAQGRRTPGRRRRKGPCYGDAPRDRGIKRLSVPGRTGLRSELELECVPLAGHGGTVEPRNCRFFTPPQAKYTKIFARNAEFRRSRQPGRSLRNPNDKGNDPAIGLLSVLVPCQPSRGPWIGDESSHALGVRRAAGWPGFIRSIRIEPRPDLPDFPKGWIAFGAGSVTAACRRRSNRDSRCTPPVPGRRTWWDRAG